MKFITSPLVIILVATLLGVGLSSYLVLKRIPYQLLPATEPAKSMASIRVVRGKPTTSPVTDTSQQSIPIGGRELATDRAVKNAALALLTASVVPFTTPGPLNFTLMLSGEAGGVHAKTSRQPSSG